MPFPTLACKEATMNGDKTKVLCQSSSCSARGPINGLTSLTKPSTKGSTALLATAFQDHFSRSLSLTDSISKKKQVNYKLPVTKKFPVSSRINTSITNAGRVIKEGDQINSEKEYVLDPQPSPLSLAQKLGLVESPDCTLSEDEWQHAKKRSNEREDSTNPCPICKEVFGLKEQVLLSCTHVFHKICLQSFERFTGKKVCPLCRKEQYQTRLIHEGAKRHRETCAVKIQATWRGYVIRTWYKELRKKIPPCQPLLRKKFFQERLSEITDRVLRSSENFQLQVDNLFHEINENLSYSQSVMRQLDAGTDGNLSCRDWDAIQLKAVERGEIDCPICMMPLKVHPREEEATVQERASVLLSCSHVYHSVCLESFEDFAFNEKLVCPVCRSSYQKQKICYYISEGSSLCNL